MSCSFLQYNESTIFSLHINQKQERRIEEYIEQIKLHLGDNSNRKYFIGYAQVLCILARQIELEYSVDKTLSNLHKMIQPSSSNYLIYDIIQQLILREQDKLQHFKDSIREKYVSLHISLYSKYFPINLGASLSSK